MFPVSSIHIYWSLLECAIIGPRLAMGPSRPCPPIGRLLIFCTNNFAQKAENRSHSPWGAGLWALAKQGSAYSLQFLTVQQPGTVYINRFGGGSGCGQGSLDSGWGKDPEKPRGAPELLCNVLLKENWWKPHVRVVVWCQSDVEHLRIQRKGSVTTPLSESCFSQTVRGPHLLFRVKSCIPQIHVWEREQQNRKKTLWMHLITNQRFCSRTIPYHRSPESTHIVHKNGPSTV